MIWIFWFLAYLCGYRGEDMQGARLWLSARWARFRGYRLPADQGVPIDPMLEHRCTWIQVGATRFGSRNDFYAREGGGIRIGTFQGDSQVVHIIGEHAHVLCIPTGPGEGTEILLGLNPVYLIQEIYGYSDLQGSALQGYGLERLGKLLRVKGLRSNEIAVEVLSHHGDIEVFIIRLPKFSSSADNQKAWVLDVQPGITFDQVGHCDYTVLTDTLGRVPLILTENGTTNPTPLRVSKIGYMAGNLFLSTYSIRGNGIFAVRALERTGNGYTVHAEFPQEFVSDALPGWVSKNGGNYGDPIVDTKGIGYTMVITPDRTALLCPSKPSAIIITADTVVYEDGQGDIKALWCAEHLHEWETSKNKQGVEYLPPDGVRYSLWDQGKIYILRSDTGTCSLNVMCNGGATACDQIADLGPENDVGIIRKAGYNMGWAPIGI